MLTWNDLAAEIEKMNPAQRKQPVVTQDYDTGEYIGYRDVAPLDRGFIGEAHIRYELRPSSNEVKMS